MTGCVFLNKAAQSICKQFFPLGHSCTLSGIGAAK